MKKLVVGLSILFLLSVFPPEANASILFQDNFENGPSKWNTKMGDSSMWKVEDGKLKFSISSASTFSAITSDSISTDSYILEFDYYPITGEDKNISFRWNDNLFYPHYDIHFVNNGGIFSQSNIADDWPKFTSFTLANDNAYHFKIVLNNQKIKVFVNNSKIFDVVDSDFNYMPNDKVGLWATTGSVFPTEVWFDNIVVKTIDEEPQETDLDVPLLKQTSEPWQSKVYDTANMWSPLNPSINRWGCALTSVAMILQYYGINKMPDNTTLNPDSINTWLKMQPDGYVGNGYLNWLAITRLSRLSKLSSNNPDFQHDALEYSRYGGHNEAQLTDDLNSGLPDILEEPGHFIVAKGISGSTFTINDPFYERMTLNDGYNNKFTSIGHYTPSNTDLSYIMITAPKDIHLELSDENGNIINDEFLQNPITDPVTNLPSGNAVNTLYLQQPLSGNYTIKISSFTKNSYTLNTYLYDALGNVKVFTNSGTLVANGTRTIPVIFDKDNAANSSVKKDITFQSIIDYINKAVKEGKIQKAAGNSLTTLLKTAEKSYTSKNIKLAKIKLAAAEVLLLGYKKTNNVSGETYTAISEDLKELKSSL